MSRFVVLTDSLGAHAGGLAHATLNLAIACADCLQNDRVFIVSQADHSEIDIGMSLPHNLVISKYSGLRNPLFPYSPKAWETLCSLEPDVVHLRGLWRQSSNLAVRWKKTNPNKSLIVQTAGMLEPWAWKRNSITKKIYYQLLEAEVLRVADLIHATSLSEKENLIQFGLPSAKIFIVEEGVFVPPQQNLPNTTEQTDPSDARTLLFLARLHPVKGLDLLLEGLSLVRPRGWKCKIAGMGHPSYVLELQRSVERYGLTDIVSFCGPLSGVEKDRAFSEASAFILPSYSESFGISIAEAMSWGLPVITTNQTPWSDLALDQMGWVVSPDISGISRALFELFNTSWSERREMGQKARSYIEARYSWNTLGIKIAEIYSHLIN